jgi:hypothetical protein
MMQFKGSGGCAGWQCGVLHRLGNPFVPADQLEAPHGHHTGRRWMSFTKLKLLSGVAGLLCGFLPPPVHAKAQEVDNNGFDILRPYAVHVFRSPRQSWPGYGIYLGRGLVITAAHVVGRVGLANPSVGIAGQELTAELVKRGDFEGVDLTLLRIDASGLPPRVGLRVLPLCETPPVAGEPVITVTPETVAHSTILPPERLPLEIRSRFGTAIADVAATGNSGSGVFDAAKQCLLGIMSRKIQKRIIASGNAADAGKLVDLAKYFVPAAEIRQFIGP